MRLWRCRISARRNSCYRVAMEFYQLRTFLVVAAEERHAGRAAALRDAPLDQQPHQGARGRMEREAVPAHRNRDGDHREGPRIAVEGRGDPAGGPGPFEPRDGPAGFPAGAGPDRVELLHGSAPGAPNGRADARRLPGVEAQFDREASQEIIDRLLAEEVDAGFGAEKSGTGFPSDPCRAWTSMSSHPRIGTESSGMPDGRSLPPFPGSAAENPAPSKWKSIGSSAPRGPAALCGPIRRRECPHVARGGRVGSRGVRQPGCGARFRPGARRHVGPRKAALPSVVRASRIPQGRPAGQAVRRIRAGNLGGARVEVIPLRG